MFACGMPMISVFYCFLEAEIKYFFLFLLKLCFSSSLVAFLTFFRIVVFSGTICYRVARHENLRSCSNNYIPKK